MICYNRRALQRAGWAVAASTSESQNLGFPAKERKVRTPQGSEPANGGAPREIQIPNSSGKVDPELVGWRQVQQRTDQPAKSDFEISNLNKQVMGETVRPARATEISDLESQIWDFRSGISEVRAHRRVWRHARPGKLLAVQDQIGRRFRAARSKPPGRSLDPTGNGWARGMIATLISDLRH